MDSSLFPSGDCLRYRTASKIYLENTEYPKGMKRTPQWKLRVSRKVPYRPGRIEILDDAIPASFFHVQWLPRPDIVACFPRKRGVGDSVILCCVRSLPRCQRHRPPACLQEETVNGSAASCCNRDRLIDHRSQRSCVNAPPEMGNRRAPYSDAHARERERRMAYL